ncbi:uncharacterized protein B0I36DRAFT_359531 [Microdochium trichocladiopsis]|uniref:AMP-activated protein kinase glycogen-binding domain-containing protein n=1 Tax=Microdochium trichocladiopsis TaxID=1682393 RepID=A0A9P9BSH3_9PEZI|nr:uncharacterized protein B0I36DRAFT_359531 [Microdochium trichocladiopsis]KAH7037900.1 hypothetical protein B0I36DRAFT_359531 [Microdochium trichocladiopsis]
MSASQVTAEFAFHKPGTQPPVYIAGSFTDPPWQPHEMEAAKRDDGEYIFKRSWPVKGGIDIQYKYRIGNGDCWVLDEGEQVVDDGHGNLNNTLSTSRFTSEYKEGDTGKLLLPRVGALRDSERPSRTVTPDFVRTTIEVSDSAALLHDEVPSREVPRHLASTAADSPQEIHTPIEEVARTAAEVANTAAKLDDEDLSGEDDNDEAHPDDPPMLAHECMFGEDSNREYTSRPPENLSPSPKRNLDRWEKDETVQPDIDLDDPRLERFPSERSAIYATVRRLSTSVDHDDVGTTLAVPRSPGAYPDDRMLGEGYAASPIDIDSPADGSRWLRTSDASHSPDKDVGLKSVSSLQSIPEGDDDEAPRKTSRTSRPSRPAEPKSYNKSNEGGGHVDDEGISMNVPVRERTPKYTWEKKPRGRSGSLTDHDAMTGADDAGPSMVAINHTQIDTPDVLVHGPELVDDGGDCTTSSGYDTVPNMKEGSKAGAAKAQIPAQRPGTRSTVHSVQTVASLQSPKSSSTWLKSWFRVVFIDFFGGIFKRLFRR